jgi:predicted ATP-dependent endonuclease of OLD family
MLQFVLSPKSILLEGDAEFILMEALFKRAITKELFSSGVGVISVDGKCFKRYLDIAKLLGNKVAVITDNDHDYANNITSNYSDYSTFNNIGIYSDTDNTRYTFEVCMYKDNKDICDNEFQSARRILSVK